MADVQIINPFGDPFDQLLRRYEENEFKSLTLLDDEDPPCLFTLDDVVEQLKIETRQDSFCEDKEEISTKSTVKDTEKPQVGPVGDVSKHVMLKEKRIGSLQNKLREEAKLKRKIAEETSTYGNKDTYIKNSYCSYGNKNFYCINENYGLKSTYYKEPPNEKTILDETGEGREEKLQRSFQPLSPKINAAIAKFPNLNNELHSGDSSRYSFPKLFVSGPIRSSILGDLFKKPLWKTK